MDDLEMYRMLYKYMNLFKKGNKFCSWIYLQKKKHNMISDIHWIYLYHIA